jgi:hypothetical protein
MKFNITKRFKEKIIIFMLIFDYSYLRIFLNKILAFLILSF